MMEKRETVNMKREAGKGLLWVLPFLILNFVVVLRIEPLYSFLGSFPVIRNSLYLPLVLTLLFPIGAFVSIRPVLWRKNGKRVFPILNIIVATVLLIFFVLLAQGLGKDFYHCEILRIPNCD